MSICGEGAVIILSRLLVDILVLGIIDVFLKAKIV